MRNPIKYFILTILIIFLTACGTVRSTGDANQTLTPKEIAIQKITAYTQSNGTTTAPTIEDYTDAGVNGVDNEEKLQKINEAISKISKEDVDTKEKIQQFIESIELEYIDRNNTQEPQENKILVGEKLVTYKIEKFGLTPKIPSPPVIATIIGDKEKKQKIQNAWDKALIDGERKWKSIMYGETNVATDVHIKDDTITIGVDLGGVIRSTDKGASWRYISRTSKDGIEHYVCSSMDVNPKSLDNIIVTTQGSISYTLDGGLTWHRSKGILPSRSYGRQSNSLGITRFNSDGSRIFATHGSLYFYDSHSSSSTVHADHPRKEIYISKDRGVTFSAFTISGTSKYSDSKFLLAHPLNKNIMYVSFADGSLYYTLNAKADIPSFALIYKFDSFIRGMSINPFNPSEMMLVGNDGNIYRATEVETKKVVLNKLSKRPLSSKRLQSIQYHPTIKNQIVVGENKTLSIYKSNDNGISWETIKLPKELLKGELQNFYGNLDRVYQSKDFSVITTTTKTYITRDNFKTFEMLVHGYDNGYWTSKGVGCTANVQGISFNPKTDKMYVTGQDIGVYSSDGDNYRRWKVLNGINNHYKFPKQMMDFGLYTWAQKPIYTFHTDNAVYFIALKHNNPIKVSTFREDKRVFKSIDDGENWIDITSNFPEDALIEDFNGTDVNGNPADKCFRGIDKTKGTQVIDSLVISDDEFYIMFSKQIYKTTDGGNSFSRLLTAPLSNNTVFQITYSGIYKHSNKLYISISQNQTISSGNHLSITGKGGKPAPMYVSNDNGVTWQVVNVGKTSISTMVVTNSGNIVIGTSLAWNIGGSKTFYDAAHLCLIPAGSTTAEVKHSLGLTKQEIGATQRIFKFMTTDGTNVAVLAGPAPAHSDIKYGDGLYLSRDEGKTWELITDDLPTLYGYNMKIHNGKIYFSSVAGVFEYDL